MAVRRSAHGSAPDAAGRVHHRDVVVRDQLGHHDQSRHVRDGRWRSAGCGGQLGVSVRRRRGAHHRAARRQPRHARAVEPDGGRRRDGTDRGIGRLLCLPVCVERFRPGIGDQPWLDRGVRTDRPRAGRRTGPRIGDALGSGTRCAVRWGIRCGSWDLVPAGSTAGSPAEPGRGHAALCSAGRRADHHCRRPVPGRQRSGDRHRRRADLHRRADPAVPDDQGQRHAHPAPGEPRTRSRAAGVRRPADRLPNRGAVHRPGGPRSGAAPAEPAPAGAAVHRPRRLQGGERHPRAPGRRRAGNQGRRAAAGRDPFQRHGRPVRRRRVRRTDRG